MHGRQITFIGTGQMARALARGMVQAQLVEGAQIAGFDPDQQAQSQFTAEVSGARLTSSGPEAARRADIVVLAVKPQVLPAVARELRSVLTDRQLVMSVAAGVSLRQLADWLGSERVVRVMPNTPCLVGRGASAYALGEQATSEDARVVESMLAAVGFVCQVGERYLDAVTGLSGSGPAYIYLLIEALSDGGVLAGLTRDVATQLAAHTVRGAAEMVIGTAVHPAVLKDRVTSPGGTTIAGIQALEEHGLRAACMAAVEAATARARQLGDKD